MTDYKPRRLQRSRAKGWRKPPNSVCVTRGTAWGNPYRVGIDGTAEECVWKFAKLILPYAHGGTLEEFYLSEANLCAVQLDLRGKDLICWCAEDAPHCHANLLLAWANGPLID